MKSIIYTIIVILLLACEGSVSKKDWSSDKVEQDATKMLYEYHAAIAKDGLTAEFRYLDNSENFFWVPPGYSSKLNYDSVQKILVENALAFTSIDLKWDALEVFPISEEIATYSGIVLGQMTDTSGQISETAIIESGTLIKRKDGWKVLSGQSAVLADHLPE